jgi:hypothetical protein
MLIPYESFTCFDGEDNTFGEPHEPSDTQKIECDAVLLGTEKVIGDFAPLATFTGGVPARLKYIDAPLK